MPNSRRQAHTKTVLVVDDNPDLGLLLTLLFERDGIRAITSLNGNEALQLIANGPQPDLIITDLEMPVMDGKDFIAQFRSNSQHAEIPIIVASGKSLLPQEIETYGVQGILSKPFDLDEVHDLVMRLLFKRPRPAAQDL